MIDYLLTFDSEADAVGALPDWLDEDGNWLPDCIPDVRAYKVLSPATDEDPEQREVLAGYRISIFCREANAALAGMPGAIVIDWDVANPLAVLGETVVEPVRAV
ncbi:hypothetical protein [Microbaculum marinum]|uniref:YCII-related domain-containing protein n=1 Tax=Microbaculum marinum TaxID=1764581 RepID=A0AAW9RCF7_9HYPH